MGLGEIRLGEMGLGEMGLGEMGQNPLDTPTPLVSKIFNGLFLGLSLRMFRPNLKFIALSVPEIIGGAG